MPWPSHSHRRRRRSGPLNNKECRTRVQKTVFSAFVSSRKTVVISLCSFSEGMMNKNGECWREDGRTRSFHSSFVLCICLLHLLLQQSESHRLRLLEPHRHQPHTSRTCACSGSGGGNDSMRISICLALRTRSATNSCLFSTELGQPPRREWPWYHRCKPSNFFGESILSFGRDFVTGMSGETCLKSVRWTSWTTASFMMRSNCSTQSWSWVSLSMLTDCSSFSPRIRRRHVQRSGADSYSATHHTCPFPVNP